MEYKPNSSTFQKPRRNVTSTLDHHAPPTPNRNCPFPPRPAQNFNTNSSRTRTSSPFPLPRTPQNSPVHNRRGKKRKEEKKEKRKTLNAPTTPLSETPAPQSKNGYTLQHTTYPNCSLRGRIPRSPGTHSALPRSSLVASPVPRLCFTHLHVLRLAHIHYIIKTYSLRRAIPPGCQIRQHE